MDSIRLYICNSVRANQMNLESRRQGIKCFIDRESRGLNWFIHIYCLLYNKTRLFFMLKE